MVIKGSWQGPEARPGASVRISAAASVTAASTTPGQHDLIIANSWGGPHSPIGDANYALVGPKGGDDVVEPRGKVSAHALGEA